MNRAGVVAAAVGLLAGLAPAARADSEVVLEGHIALGAGPNGTDCADPACAAFFAAGCPQSLASPDGASVSIVDVRALAGKRLTFTWRDTTTRLWDAGVPTVAGIYFYVARSCTQPTISDAFGVDTIPNERTITYTLPQDATWLVASPNSGASNVMWQATS